MPRTHVTFFAAHTVPAEYFGRRHDYIEAVSQWCDEAAAAGADGMDVFCAEGRFNAREARKMLGAGRAAGLLPRLHAGGPSHLRAARLAADLGCASADLLDEADDDDVAALASAGVAAVVCPAPALEAGRRPPVRALLDKRVTVALGSDHSAGGNAITSMPLVISLAISYFGMSVSEALRAATIGGAQALRAPDRGVLARGRYADVVLWDADHEGAFVNSYGLKPLRVWRGGSCVPD